MKLHLEYEAGLTPVTLDAAIDGASYRAGNTGATRVFQQVQQILASLISLDIPFTFTSTTSAAPVVASPVLPINPIQQPVSTVPVTPPTAENVTK
jgi:hypothetical protein